MNVLAALNHSNLLGPNWKHWEGIAPVSRLDVRIKAFACVAKYAPKRGKEMLFGRSGKKQQRKDKTNKQKKTRKNNSASQGLKRSLRVEPSRAAAASLLNTGTMYLCPAI